MRPIVIIASAIAILAPAPISPREDVIVWVDYADNIIATYEDVHEQTHISGPYTADIKDLIHYGPHLIICNIAIETIKWPVCPTQHWHTQICEVGVWCGPPAPLPEDENAELHP